LSLLGSHAHDLSGLSTLGWGIVLAAGVFVAWVFWRAIVLTLRPNEDDPQHIKHQILEEDPRREGEV